LARFQQTADSLDTAERGTIFQLALPNTENAPPVFSQGAVLYADRVFSTANFRAPIQTVCRRSTAINPVSMPKKTVNQHRDSPSSEKEIGFSVDKLVSTPAVNLEPSA
jgi:hypothetical protein